MVVEYTNIAFPSMRTLTHERMNMHGFLTLILSNCAYSVLQQVYS